MSEISRINIGLQQTNLKKETEKPAQKEVAEAKVENQPSQNIDAKTMLSAMDNQGRLNAAHFNLRNSVDPTKYLSQERIQDIEASMGVFDKGVNKHLEALNKEFGALDIKEADKLAIAAEAFAKSE